MCFFLLAWSPEFLRPPPLCCAFFFLPPIPLRRTQATRTHKRTHMGRRALRWTEKRRAETFEYYLVNSVLFYSLLSSSKKFRSRDILGRMNAFLLLGVLLLAVPMQLLLNHVIKSTETGASLQNNALDRYTRTRKHMYYSQHVTSTCCVVVHCVAS